MTETGYVDNFHFSFIIVYLSVCYLQFCLELLHILCVALSKSAFCLTICVSRSYFRTLAVNFISDLKKEKKYSWKMDVYAREDKGYYCLDIL